MLDTEEGIPEGRRKRRRRGCRTRLKSVSDYLEQFQCRELSLTLDGINIQCIACERIITKCDQGQRIRVDNITSHIRSNQHKTLAEKRASEMWSEREAAGTERRTTKSETPQSPVEETEVLAESERFLSNTIRTSEKSLSRIISFPFVDPDDGGSKSDAALDEIALHRELNVISSIDTATGLHQGISKLNGEFSLKNSFFSQKIFFLSFYFLFAFFTLQFFIF